MARKLRVEYPGAIYHVMGDPFVALYFTVSFRTQIFFTTSPTRTAPGWTTFALMPRK
jgi:hypothetical protein